MVVYLFKDYPFHIFRPTSISSIKSRGFTRGARGRGSDSSDGGQGASQLGAGHG